MAFWPFKRKTVSNSNSNNDFLSFSQAKLSSKSAIVGGFIGAFLCLGGAATGIGISAWKYTLGSEFGKSYNIRFELDTEGENPFYTTPDTDIEKELNDSANAYSKFLNSKGIDNVTVYPEYYVDDEHHEHLYINANIPNQKYHDDITDTDKDIDPSVLYTRYVESSRLCLVVNQRDSDDKSPYHTSIIPISDAPQDNEHKHLKYAHKNNSITGEDQGIDAFTTGADKKDVAIHLDTSLTEFVQNVLESNDASATSKADSKTQIFLVKDYYGLTNYMNYILQAYSEAGGWTDQGNGNANDIVNNLQSNEEKNFYQNYYEDDKTNNHHPAKEDKFINTDDLKARKWSYDDSGNINGISDDSTDIRSIPSSPLWFTGKGVGTASEDVDTDKLSYSFLSKYIYSFGSFSDKNLDKDTENGDTSLFTNVIPLVDPSTGKVPKEDKDKYKYLMAHCSSRNAANELLSSIKDYAFSLPIKSVHYQITDNNWSYEPGLTWDTTDNKYSTGTLVDIRNQIIQEDKTLQNTFMNLDPIIGIVVALCLIILAIGILVSVLYRGPGLIGALAIIAAFALSLMILILSSYAISVPLIMGLFIGICGSTLCIFTLFERIKKVYYTGIAFDAAVRKGVKLSFWHLIDIHVVMLLLGVAITYFAGVQLIAMGLVLLLYSLLSLFFICGLWLGSIILLLNNRLSTNKPQWLFSRKKQLPTMQRVLEHKSYETMYCGQFAQKKFSCFGWKQIVTGSILLGLIIIGIILIFTVGVGHSYFFYGGTRIILPLALFNDIGADKFGSYSQMLHAGDNVILYYNVTPDHITALPFYSDEGTSWLPGFNNIFDDGQTHVDIGWISIQSIVSGGAIDYVKSSIYTLLIASGFVCAYTIIRLNWVSVIAVFLGSLLTPLLTVGILAICQIYFDLYVVISIVVLYGINVILLINFVGTINNQWLRKQLYLAHDLKTCINTEVKNSLWFYLTFYITVVASLLILLIFSSSSLVWCFFILIVGMLCSIPVLYSVVPFFLYLFVRLRYYYIVSTSTFENPLLRKNYDNVDEQLLEGINKYNKKKPVV